MTCLQTIKVVDQDGIALSNARVAVEKPDGGTLSGFTSAGGIVEFTLEVDKNHHAVATKSGYVDNGQGNVWFPSCAYFQLVLEASETPEFCASVVSVMDEVGSSLEGATVTLTEAGTPISVKTTNSNGTVEFNTQKGNSYTATAQKSGYSQISDSIKNFTACAVVQLTILSTGGSIEEPEEPPAPTESFLEAAADTLWDAGSWIHDHADSWLVSAMGDASQVLHDAGSAVRWTSARLRQANSWIKGIEIDGKNAYATAHNSLNKVMWLSDWKVEINGLENWAQDLWDNFTTKVRDEVSDVIIDVNDLMINLGTKVRTELTDELNDLADVVDNFASNVRTELSTEIVKIDDLWDNFTTKVKSALGQDWQDMLDFMAAFEADYLEPVHEKMTEWLTEKSDLIYSFVTDRLDDLWFMLRSEIKSTVNFTADWWFDLAEKIIDKVGE